MKFYGDTQDANTPSTGASAPAVGGGLYGTIAGAYGGGGGSGVAAPKNTDQGKGQFDFGNALGSIGTTLGNFKDFTTGLVGGIGIPGGPNIGDVAKLPGEALDAAGQLPVPGGGNVGGVAQTVGSIPGFLEHKVEAGVAGARIGGNPLADLYANLTQKNDIGANFAGGGPTFGEIASQAHSAVQAGAVLPPEYQARLDNGESVDAIANDMATKGVGFSNNPGANAVASIIFDPLNLVSFGAGKAFEAAKGASEALAAGKQLGVGDRVMGTAYAAASRNLSAGGATLMDRMIGPTTSGVFHALGTKPYFAIRNGVGAISPAYAAAFEDAFAHGAAQLPRAVIARYMGEDVRAGVLAVGDKVGQQVEARLAALKKISPGHIERRTEELMARVAPDFTGHTDAERFIETRDKLAAITGMSPEDAARALGGKANLRTAQQVHLAFYGKAGDDLARAKAASATAKNIDPERLTLIAPDTLTEDAAARILGGEENVADAVDNYSILRNKFGSTNFEHSKVLDFVGRLRDEGALAKTVIADVTRKNPLPPALGDWRAAYNKFGYEIGFAPKDGWKTIVDHDGNVLYGDPFIHFTSEADPLTYRNPLGRMVDSLFRGTTQTSIILDSRNRMVQLARKAGVDASAQEMRAIHSRILEMAAEAHRSPRGLSLLGGTTYNDIFREVLGHDRYAEFTKKLDPTFAVMKSFEGNLSRVGLTQKFTGKAKTAFAERGNMVAGIADGIYPDIRFRYSPLFQSQEVFESPFFNIMRGVTKRAVDPETAKLYEQLADLPDFKYLAEAGYTLNLWGGAEVGRTITANNTLIGKALRGVPNVKGFKEEQRVAQVFHEHPTAFKDAVNQINPKLWAAMEDGYGTNDPAAIADAFLAERQALASGNLDEAMSVFDSAKPALHGADEETVWQAFRESFRQASQQAFTTHYFKPERGFLERSINHPYLGIYPASYMWGKVLPEFTRFLLKRPFGLNAPLAGIEAYQRVQQAVIASLATDPDMQKWVGDSANNGAIYLAEQLLPATPNDLPANAPAWARHLSQQESDLAKNPRYKTNTANHKKGEAKNFDPQTFIKNEAGDAAQYAVGPVRSVNAFGNAFADIFDRLQETARQLDAQFPTGH